jgi:SAM-dependent methyltransferase
LGFAVSVFNGAWTNVRRALLQLFWWLERRITPGVKSTQYRYAEILGSLLSERPDWLDVGCGHAILPDWVPGQELLLARARSVVGFDYDQPSLKKHRQIRRLVAGDLNRLPFAAGSFDLVTANMVVEHLADPAAALAEIARVLRPGGKFLFHTPNKRFYMMAIAARTPQWIKNKLARYLEGRHEGDVFPTQYRLNTFEDVEAQASRAGVIVSSCESLNSSNAGAIMLGPLALIDLLVKRLTSSDSLEQYRSNFVVLLEKPPAARPQYRKPPARIAS